MRTTKLKIIVAAVAVLAVAAAVAFYFVQKSDNRQSASQESDRQEVNERKETLPDNPEKPSTPTPESGDPGQPSSSKKPVTVNITYPIASDKTPDPDSVDALLPDYITNEGICTATFRGPAGQTFQRTSAPRAAASSTSCSSIPIKRSDFSAAGTWSVTVSFASSTAEGTSQTISFEVSNGQ